MAQMGRFLALIDVQLANIILLIQRCLTRINLIMLRLKGLLFFL